MELHFSVVCVKTRPETDGERQRRKCRTKSTHERTRRLYRLLCRLIPRTSLFPTVKTAGLYLLPFLRYSSLNFPHLLLTPAMITDELVSVFTYAYHKTKVIVKKRFVYFCTDLSDCIWNALQARFENDYAKGLLHLNL